jgi:flagellar biosynthesis protein FliR
MDLALFEQQAVSLFLHFVRTGAFLFVVPFFGRQRDTFFLRLVLSVALGSMMWWNGGQSVELPRSLIEMGFLVMTESFLGLALGFALGVLSALLRVGGGLLFGGGFGRDLRAGCLGAGVGAGLLVFG